MHSSISSSERAIPALPWGRTAALAGVLLIAAVTGWELYWRSQGLVPAPMNSDGLWALQRRAVEPRSTVLVGSSRVLFDIDLDVWTQELGAEPPIQLALEGTSGFLGLRDVASDSDFGGYLVVGVTPGLYFSGGGVREDAFEYARKETPSQRIAQRAGMTLERVLAFIDGESALRTLLRRAPWPVRPGKRAPLIDVHKLSVMREDRQTKMWSKVSSDPEYRELARRVWRQFQEPPFNDPVPDEKLSEIIEESVTLVERVRSRGGAVLFVRLPSSDVFRAGEKHQCSRERCWDRLIAAVEHTGAIGIHFEDHPELQGFTLPEWSHVVAEESYELTRALTRLARPHYEAWRSSPRP